MADYKHQDLDLQAAHQHLANRKQEASATPVALVHQHQAQVMHQHQVGEQHQWQQPVDSAHQQQVK